MQADLLQAHRLRLVAGQLLRVEIARQYHLDLLAHVAGRQRQLGEQLQTPGAEAGLLLQLAVGRFQHILARLDQPLGQRQLVAVGTAAVLLDQQRILGVGQRHDHHRSVAAALADQALVGAFHTVGEAQLQFLDAEQAAAGDDFTGEHGGFLAHGELLETRAAIITRVPALAVSALRPAERPARPHEVT